MTRGKHLHGRSAKKPVGRNTTRGRGWWRSARFLMVVVALGTLSLPSFAEHLITYAALNFDHPEDLPIVRTFTWPHAPLAEFDLLDRVPGGGERCGKLTYHFFLPGEREQAGIWASQRLPGKPEQITCRIRGDGSGHRLDVILFDRTGERFAFSLGDLDFEGWGELSGQVTKPLWHHMGNNNGVLDYPATLARIIVTQATAAARPFDGHVLLDWVKVHTRVASGVAILGVSAAAPGALFAPTQKPHFRVDLVNPGPGDAPTRVWWRASRDDGLAVVQGSVAVVLSSRERRQVEAKLSALVPGWYSLQVGAGDDLQPQWATSFGVLRQAPAKGPATSASPMGINVHGGGMTRGDLARWFRIVRRVGAQWVRFWQFQASRVWLTEGNDGFGEYDDVVAAARDAGVRLLPIVSWQYAYLPEDHQRFGDWMGALVARYKPGGELARERDWADGYGVSAWEIINEPNIPESYFHGTVDDYRSMLGQAHAAAKREDPECLVVCGGMAYGEIGYLLDIVKQGGAELFDIANQHYYRSPLAPELGTYLPDLAKCREAVEGFAPGRPIWITETAYPVAPNRQHHAGVPADVQAKFLARMYLLVLAQEPSARIFYFPTVGNYGIFNEDFTPKPSAVAYRTISEQIGDARYVGALDADAETYALVFDRGGEPVIAAWRLPDVRIQARLRAGAPLELGQRVTLDDMGERIAGYISRINSVPTLFAHTWRPRATELDLGAPQITQIDLMGRAQTLRCSGTRLRVHLDDSPVFLEGAAPSVLAAGHSRQLWIE